MACTNKHKYKGCPNKYKNVDWHIIYKDCTRIQIQIQGFFLAFRRGKYKYKLNEDDDKFDNKCITPRTRHTSGAVGLSFNIAALQWVSTLIKLKPLSFRRLRIGILIVIIIIHYAKICVPCAGVLRKLPRLQLWALCQYLEGYRSKILAQYYVKTFLFVVINQLTVPIARTQCTI